MVNLPSFNLNSEDCDEKKISNLARDQKSLAPLSITSKLIS